MNKIKVIDLLNMISKGEEVPKKVKFAGIIFEYDEDDQMYGNDEHKNICDYAFLNDEVEILEEEKKIPEKLEDYDFDDGLDANTKCECLRERMQEIENQLDEIIDYLKSKGE